MTILFLITKDNAYCYNFTLFLQIRFFFKFDFSIDWIKIFRDYFMNRMTKFKLGCLSSFTFISNSFTENKIQKRNRKEKKMKSTTNKQLFIGCSKVPSFKDIICNNMVI